MKPYEVEEGVARHRLTRRTLLSRGTRVAVGVALSGFLPLTLARAAEPELGIADLQAAMAAGSLTAHGLVQSYLDRILALNLMGPMLHAVIEINPDALAIADMLDAERQAKGPRGPLHGIPILLKDNIGTADRMMTTAGSYALVGDPPAQDATVAGRLRQAGAILLGKTNLSELLYEFKTNLNAYLATRTGVPIQSLADLIAFDKAHSQEEQLSRYDQGVFVAAQQKGMLTDTAYLKALDKSQAQTRAAIDATMANHQLTAMVSPGLSNAIGDSARAGYPLISVPAGFARGLPENLLFTGGAYSEPALLKLAYAFEQLTKARRPPTFLTALTST